MGLTSHSGLRIKGGVLNLDRNELTEIDFNSLIPYPEDFCPKWVSMESNKVKKVIGDPPSVHTYLRYNEISELKDMEISSKKHLYLEGNPIINIDGLEVIESHLYLGGIPSAGSLMKYWSGFKESVIDIGYTNKMVIYEKILTNNRVLTEVYEKVNSLNLSNLLGS